MMIDLSTWYSKAQTAARLGTSERNLDRLCDEGKGPERRYRQRPRKRPEPVFKPEQVDQMLALGHAAANPPRVMPPVLETAAANGDKAITHSNQSELPPGMLRFFEVIERLSNGGRPAARQLYLTVQEAAEYTGLSETYLRRAIQEGRLPFIRDRGYKIARIHLDHLAVDASDRDSAAALAKTRSAGLGSGEC